MTNKLMGRLKVIFDEDGEHPYPVGTVGEVRYYSAHDGDCSLFLEDTNLIVVPVDDVEFFIPGEEPAFDGVFTVGQEVYLTHPMTLQALTIPFEHDFGSGAQFIVIQERVNALVVHPKNYPPTLPIYWRANAEDFRPVKGN